MDAIAATQGVYSRQNTSREAAPSGERTEERASADGSSTESVATTLSFAIKPVIRAVDTRQSPNPSGVKMGAIRPATPARMLCCESVTRCSCRSVSYTHLQHALRDRRRQLIQTEKGTEKIPKGFVHGTFFPLCHSQKQGSGLSSGALRSFQSNSISFISSSTRCSSGTLRTIFPLRKTRPSPLPPAMPTSASRASVSYTHLDVYKRQLRRCVPSGSDCCGRSAAYNKGAAAFPRSAALSPPDGRSAWWNRDASQPAFRGDPPSYT